MQAPPDLSIIIVSWNVRDLLADCLTSIDQHKDTLDVQVIVVDSASQDDTVDMVQRRFPGIILLAQEENVGFTRGNNIGLRAATGRHLLLLNPDTVVLHGALMRMVTYLDDHPEIGIVGPHTLNGDGSHQSTRRRFPWVALAFFESTWLQPLAPQHMMIRFKVADVPDDAIVRVDWVQGSALMARREVYDDIGGLDEAFVMFSEEVDWCKRAADADWPAVYLGDAKIVHYGGKSTGQVAARKHVHFQQSKLRYFHKHHGPRIARVLRLFLLLSYRVQIVIETSKALLGHKRALRQERVAAYREVLRSGLRVIR